MLSRGYSGELPKEEREEVLPQQIALGLALPLLALVSLLISISI
jgi:hypothetical protein